MIRIPLIAILFAAIFILSYLAYSGTNEFGDLIVTTPIEDLPTQPTPKETYFAEIDSKGHVLRVIVADQAFINTGAVGDPSNWIQTDMDGTIKKNPAVIGGTYDAATDAFIAPKPFESWILDETTSKWKPPKDPPASASTTDDALRWNEAKQEWEQFKVRNLKHL